MPTFMFVPSLTILSSILTTFSPTFHGSNAIIEEKDNEENNFKLSSIVGLLVFLEFLLYPMWKDSQEQN